MKIYAQYVWLPKGAELLVRTPQQSINNEPIYFYIFIMLTTL